MPRPAPSATVCRMSPRPLLLLAAILTACAPGDAPADGSFYGGRTLEVIVPFDPGGGTDTWTRMLAPHLQAALPAGAAIQVVNEPGASSVAGTNAYVLRRRPDGESAIVTAGSTYLSSLLGEPMVRYDFRTLAPVIGSPVGGVVFADPDLGARTAADLAGVRAELVYGGIAASANDVIPLLAFELLDLPVTPILGYSSKGAARIAFEQGETNIDYQTMPAYLTNVLPLVDAGEAVPLFSFGIVDDAGRVITDPAVPDLPTVRDVYQAIHGVEPTGPAWAAYRAVLLAGVNMAKTFWVHGEAPEAAVEELRAAATVMVADTAFQREARREVGDYEFWIGEDIRVLSDAASDLSPETRAWLHAWLRDRYDIDRLISP